MQGKTDEIALEDDEVHHLVALSGGKDSTALACWLNQHEPRNYQWICTPTGNELPDMIQHWKGLGRILGKPLTPVTSGTSLQGLIRRWHALPNHAQRWCTRKLKIEPFDRYAAEVGRCISYVGLRADEEKRDGMYFTETDKVTLRFPLRELGWSEGDVWDFLANIPGHTKTTMADDIPRRTDCAWCYHQTIGEWWELWDQWPEIYGQGSAMEILVTKYRGQSFTFRSPQRDTWPASLAELAKRFEAGEIPKKAGQYDLFADRKTMCRMCSL